LEFVVSLTHDGLDLRPVGATGLTFWPSAEVRGVMKAATTSVATSNFADSS
jgi:hypothetical protein